MSAARPAADRPVMTLWRLELLRLARTHRWMIPVGVFAFFGAVGPLTARYIGEIIARFGTGAEGMEIVMPDPTPVDGVVQYVSNAGQLGTLALVIVAAGALAMDARPELAAFLRTRVLEPRRLLLPRYTVVTLVGVAAWVLGTAIAWAGTAILLGDLPAGGMVAGAALGALYVAVVVAVTAAAAGVTRSAVTAIFVAVGALLVMPVLGLLPPLSPWMPTRLATAIAPLADGAPASEFWRATVVAAALVPLLLWFAGNRAARREL